MAKNVAELFIDTLVQAGVERVYGVPGDSLNGITESIRKQREIQWIHPFHTQSGYERTGRRIVDLTKINPFR